MRADSGAAEDLRAAFEDVLKTLRVPPAEREVWLNGRDVIGTAYERLLTGEQRRNTGQFYTPFWAGEVMAEWLLTDSPDLLLDAGCGSGALLIPAARSRRRGATRLLGIDRDPLAVLMAKRNARLRNFGAADFRTGHFLLDDLEERPQAVICNPPYSRHHAVPAAEKAAIHNGLTERLGVRFNRLAALHALFLLRALEVSADDARLAFITPSDWLDVGYGREIKRYLLDHARIEAVILLDGDQLFFGESVLTTAAITLIQKGKPTKVATPILRLRAPLPPPTEVLASIADRTHVGAKRVRLSESSKWSRPAFRRPHGVELREVARIRRGIATGCNEFFVISEAARKKRRLQPDELRPCATSPRAFAGNALTEEVIRSLDDEAPRWVLDVRDPSAEHANTNLGRYLRWGKRTKKAHRGYLATHRRPWYALEVRGESPILFSYFNRDRPRFVRNHIAAVPLNTWLIVEPLPGVDAGTLYDALTSEPVMQQLAKGARVYGGGLWKLEPSELAQVVVPTSVKLGPQPHSL